MAPNDFIPNTSDGRVARLSGQGFYGPAAEAVPEVQPYELDLLDELRAEIGAEECRHDARARGHLPADHQQSARTAAYQLTIVDRVEAHTTALLKRVQLLETALRIEHAMRAGEVAR